MKPLRDIRFVRIHTADLDDSVRFATRILGLELVQRDRRRAYLRASDRHHDVCYLAGDSSSPAGQPGQSVAFEAESPEHLGELAAALERAGTRVEVGTRAACDERFVSELATFSDPTGNRIELVVRPAHSGRRYFPSRDAGITSFSHVGLRSTDAPRDERFWCGALGARVSDWIGDAALLRIDEVHHKVALFPSSAPGLQHVNFQVQSVDDIMRSYYFLRGEGVRIVFGPGRHPTSGANFLYFQGPDGIVYEYSSGVRLIDRDDEATYRPRRFPLAPSSFCMWGAIPDIPEFRSSAEPMLAAAGAP